MFLRRLFLLPAVSVFLLTPPVGAQSATGAGTNLQPRQKDVVTSPSPATAAPSTSTPITVPQVAYHRPTEREKLRNFAFDAFGPYPMLTAAFGAGIEQARKTPPDWGVGADAFAARFGSQYGIQLVTTSTRYILAEAFREDTLYYRCSCTGFLPRLEHALISTVTARRGDDGHRVFSLAALGAPYAGTMTATLGWYPSRYEPMDGFRIGNYNLAAAAAQNVALEFIYGGPHSVLGRVPVVSRMHHRAGDSTSN
jgi:hypothetical protein